ncbi:MAG: deoxyribodipyrimidine photo-lyase [Verrucomicrobiota bacterium]
MAVSLVWLRRDLRLTDNPALARAIEAGDPVIPVFLWAPAEEKSWRPGGASKWWLHHALADLDHQLREAGSRLLILDARNEGSLDALLQLAKETGAKRIFWNRSYEPAIIERDKKIKKALRESGLEASSENASLLFEPTEIENKSGRPFQVFTPFWKHYRTLEIPRPVKVDLKSMKSPKKWPKGATTEELELLPRIPWDAEFSNFWGPASASMKVRMKGFIANGAASYEDERDLPATDGTSRLSPFLCFGQVGPRELWHAFAGARNFSPAFETGIMRQLIWREFSSHLLYHFPHTPDKPLRPEYGMFPWQMDEGFLRAWQKGETGYPIVDAGMRQLWQTGWMHNRVRMIVASLLVKHLLQPWQEGARWFWDTLVDADLANNTMGWQWTAGCGADAAPYFRIFNPITQGERFDPDGDYVRTYVPELAKLPKKFIHKPWEAGELELEGAGVRLGRDYPEPIIEHSEGRRRALDAFQKLKDSR